MQRAPQEELRWPRSFGPQPYSCFEPGVDAVGSRQPALALLRLLIHEMSQPITTLIGEVELALALPHDEKDFKATFERCLRSLESLRRLVADFRLAGEMNEAAMVPVPLVGLINRVVETERRRAEVRECRIKWHVPVEVYITSDPEVLTFCLKKVLAKTIAACPARNTIDIELVRGADVMLLEVSYPVSEPSEAASSATLEADLEWTLAARMIQLLGGSLNVRCHKHLDLRTSVQITLFVAERNHRPALARRGPQNENSVRLL
jgi:signal transduction histidine kinase